MFNKLLIIPCILALIACTPKPADLRSADAQELVNSLQYKQDPRTKLCFGVTATKRYNTSLQYAESIITYVPCGQLTEFQTEKDKLSDSVSNTVNSLLGE